MLQPLSSSAATTARRRRDVARNTVIPTSLVQMSGCGEPFSITDGPPAGLGYAAVMAPEDLLRPEAFSHPATDLRLLETHISWVILAGDYAYKIRKPVNLG